MYSQIIKFKFHEIRGQWVENMWHSIEGRLYVKSNVHIRNEWFNRKIMNPDLLHTITSEIQQFTTPVYNMAILHKHLHKLETTLKYVKEILERPKKYRDHRHVSATHVAIFRVVSAKIQIYL